MTKEELIEKVNNAIGSHIIGSDANAAIFTIEIAPENNLAVLGQLKSVLGFNFLTDVCGIHYPENVGKELGVIYHLQNMRANIRIRIKAFFSIENPKIESITSLWTAANWQERETFDFYGIEFTNHPTLKRIMNMETMDYFPLRKEFALEDETRTDKDDKFFGR